ncbi:MAG: DNA polymerase III subunit gamma/tau [Anaerolineales bacterium]|nr:MAG: DNA polymerase III subunit gamma/tau [Anaerolineales bacterium]
MSKVLYLKWRPGDWDEVIGQDHIITTLKNAVRQERVSHAQIFSGPRGTGKTSTARVLAKAVNCLVEDSAARPCNECAHCLSVNRGDFLDLIEIDAASNTSVDDVRELREKINFSPNLGRYKVYVVDEVHMLSTSAFNALLKTLEEPPDHAIFILATTEIHKIPITVISRCQRHDFRRISVPEIVSQLESMAASESIKVKSDVLGLIARQATGSLRDAISILDQLSSAEEEISPALAHQILGTSPDQAVLDFVDAMLAGNPGEGLSTLHQSSERGNDPIQFAKQVVAYFRNVLLMQLENADSIDVPENLFKIITAHSQQISLKKLLDLIRVFNKAINDRGASWQPTLPLEMAFLEGLDIINDGDSLGKLNVSQPSIKKDPSPKKMEFSPEPVPVQKKESQKFAPEPKQQPLTVLQEWKKILDGVREASPATQGILNSCKPLGIKDNQLVLSFRSDAIKEKMEAGDHLEICQEAIEKVIGVKLPVLCVVGGKDQSGLPDGVDPDGLVAAVVRDLGGTLVADPDNDQ